MHNPSLAPSLSRVMPSQIRTIADLAFSMDGVLKLHFGESNTQTPQYLKDAAYQALNEMSLSSPTHRPWFNEPG